MQAWEERYYDRLEAMEAGHAEGLREGLRNLIQKKLAEGKSIEEIADIVEEPIEVIKELVEELLSNEI